MSRNLPRRILMVVVLLAVTAVPLPAANKEHQQMMADIRMLQEQTQMLQAQLTAVAEALKAVGAKLDEQAGVQRKAFADQKLLVDTMSNDMRVVREKIDDNNVRISSIAQELDALRLSVAQASQPAAAPAGVEGQPPAGGAPPQGQPAAPGPVPSPGVSPTRLYDMAWADYAGGQYDLAIQGFTDFIRTFPKLDQAGAAQYYIGETYYAQGKYRDAVTAYERVISDYPNNAKVPDAYYKRGLALNVLGQTDRARESWEFAAKNFPNVDAGRLSKQKLDQLPKRDEAPEGDDAPTPEP
jgi:tol-pal system protein YbgF